MRRRRDANEPDLALLGELKLIERIREAVSGLDGMPGEGYVVKGVGDDAAVLRWDNRDDLILLTCDTLVEGVHFSPGTACYRVGWKALGCNLSDIAAMGGIPQYAVVSLALPHDVPVRQIDELYRGMVDLARRYSVAIVGGDTVESLDGLTVTVTLVGRVEAAFCVSRSGAKPGDAICVTGRLGGAGLGKHLAFQPRVEEGRFLATTCSPTSMIDISDGLGSDLVRILDASHVAAEVSAKDIPVSEEACRAAAQLQDSPLRQALYAGEDFELLFTLPGERVKECLDLLRGRFHIPATVIGDIREGRHGAILVEEDGTRAALEPGGYEHFRQARPRTTAGGEEQGSE